MKTLRCIIFLIVVQVLMVFSSLNSAQSYSPTTLKAKTDQGFRWISDKSYQWGLANDVFASRTNP